MYISDLPLGINIDSKVLLCADDTSVLISGPNIQEVQSKSLIALDIINKWCMTNGLPFHVKKTKIKYDSKIELWGQYWELSPEYMQATF